MTAPEIAICQKGETLITGSALTTTPRNSAPSSVPETEPTPPAIETPPMTQAAMTRQLVAERDLGIGDADSATPRDSRRAPTTAPETA